MTDKKPYRGEYPESEKGNFYIKDTIGVPHPYCIGTRHVSYAHAKHGGILDDDAIRGAEREANAKCDICKGQLSYDQHEQALVVGCKANANNEPHKTELRVFLMGCIEEAQKHGYAGFTLLQEFDDDATQEG